MSDRRTHQVPPNANSSYAQPQWNSGSQYPSGYATSTDQFASPPYHQNSSFRTQGAQSAPAYNPIANRSYPIANQPGYQMADRQVQYPHVPRADRASSVAVPQQTTYGVDNHQGVPMAHASTRMHSQSSSLSHSYPASPSPPQHPTAMANPSTSQHPSQIGFAQQAHTSQYPASPQRPFSCDMCALSFNRQHDLKRHRDTHTGEKPFLCNGGCGKTFTRKDALKRHQVARIV